MSKPNKCPELFQLFSIHGNNKYKFQTRRMKVMVKTIYALVAIVMTVNYCSAADIYVSPHGNDHNTGTKAKPFFSIKRAQQQARKSKGTITVYLRGGVYYLTETVEFSSKDSREKGAGVTYRSYPGEKAIISSAKVLKLQWHDYKNGIKQAHVDQDILFDELFVNGQLQHIARYPNYNPQIAHYGGFAGDAISDERINKWQDPAGGYIHALHKSEWGGFSYLITGKDGKGGLTMEGGYQNNRPAPMHAKFRYVENVFEELDTVGEWYYSKTKHTLYFYPPKNTDLNKAKIEVPQLETLFELKGTEQQPVKNISIEGLEFTQTVRTFMKTNEPLLRSDWMIYRRGALIMEGAEHCSVKNCFFNTVGGNAIVCSDYNRHNEISGCHIADIGSSGIVFTGDPKAVRSPLFRYENTNDPNKVDQTRGPQTNNYPADCLVYNNLIENIGCVEKQVAGVEISMAMNITVSHNTIDKTPRAGINISEGTWGGHIIEYNDVFNTVLETGDHGSFNSWGRDRFWYPNRKMMDSINAAQPELVLLDVIKPVIIRNNRFRCDHGWDIDLDDGSSNYEIYNNVCLNGGLKLREGFHRTVYNNIIINNSFHPHVWFNNSDDIFTHNIVMAGYFPIGIKYWGKTVDNNIFPDSLSLKKAQTRGTDQNSLYGDPGFINPSKADYRVKPESAALKVGFKNFPMDQFGVVSANLKAVAHHVAIPVLIFRSTVNNQSVYEVMGARVKNLNTLGERSATGMASETGVIVLELSSTSNLYGNIFPNDVILSLQGIQVKNINDLLKAKENIKPGAEISMEVFRDQISKKIRFILKD
ncbi:PDZ domain-containing protein [Mucilaginibacter sp.]|uniref:PDZ domain-containing protein n=1 Tax=Mucilaginibacter sp. TaxID=1882438 RepID=UPI002604607B|nr:PDZ domain-containing protein [Mucilaginibacter sp.]MDB4925975.1 peptide-binding protein [Mucilaginibacter sp.]